MGFEVQNFVINDRVSNTQSLDPSKRLRRPSPREYPDVSSTTDYDVSKVPYKRFE